MASDSTPRSSQDDLQFDRAVHAQAPNAHSDAGLTCAMCGTPFRTEYFHVAEQPTCASCKGTLERANQNAAAQGRRAGILGRAFVFGLVAAIAGAILYYAVIALTGWEIGLVAIVIGFMVGFAVRKGSGGMGGRQFQWLAVILTYFAVGLAYSPLAFKCFSGGTGAKDSRSPIRRVRLPPASLATQPRRLAASAGPGDDGSRGRRQSDSANTPGMMVALGITFLFIFALPVMYIAGSMPSGLISAMIIVIGMQQAWKMTAKPEVPISGPYRWARGPRRQPA